MSLLFTLRLAFLAVFLATVAGLALAEIRRPPRGADGVAPRRGGRR